MADDVYTTLLNFVSETAGADRNIKQTTENMKKMEEQAKRISTTPIQLVSATGKDSMSEDVEKQIKQIEVQAKRMGIAISESLKNAFRTGDVSDENMAELEALGKHVSKIHEIEDARRRELQQAIAAHRLKASLYNREASILSKTAADIRQNSQILRNQAQSLQSISQLGLGLGVGVAGGVFAFASKYVQGAKEATKVTTAWKAAQDDLAKSGAKIGAVFAEEALPLLQKAADTAAKVAGFVEKHPEIIKAALNAGMVVAGLSAVGLAVSKGIRLYADQLYLSSIPLQLRAGELQFAAAHEQLVAARMRAGLVVPGTGGGGTVPQAVPRTPGIGNVLGTLAKVTLLASSVIIGAELGLALGNAIAKLIDPNAKDLSFKETLFFGGIRANEAITQKVLEVERGLLKFLTISQKGDALVDSIFDKAQGILQKEDQFFQKLFFGIDAAKEKAVPTGVQASPVFEQVLKAYEDYKRDDLALVEKHYAERQGIIEDALKAETKANAEYARDVANVNAQRSRSIGEATRAYEAENIKAEQANAIERARIIRDGGIEIQKIEQDNQESLRKLRLGHEERLAELSASRDALGIVKEQRRYQLERNEQIRSTNLEIRQRRADLAVRLNDLQQNFQQERAERFAEFQVRLDEIRAQAREQLKELEVRHREEIGEIRAQTAERIKELDNQFKEERKRRYEYFLDQIRNLDASLLGEAQLRKRRQDEMIAELDKFLLAYKAGLKTLQTVPAGTKAGGGYAAYGTYLLGDSSGGGRGKPEYVLRGDVTELAERVLGGRVSQDKMVAMLNAFGGRNKNNVVYNDSRRIDSRISNTDRQRLVDDALSALSTALG